MDQNDRDRISSATIIAMAALILILGGNTGALFYWAGKINTAIHRLTEDVSDHEQRLRQMERRELERLRQEGRQEGRSR